MWIGWMIRKSMWNKIRTLQNEIQIIAYSHPFDMHRNKD